MGFFHYQVTALFILLLISVLVVKFIRSKKIEKILYVTLSIGCVIVASFRPFGIARDDENYEIHVERICKITDCGLIQEVDYDVGYFFLLSIAKVFFDGYLALLFLAGMALAMKLTLIARMTSYSVLSLFFYFSVFFLYHDVTQLRISMAIAIFLLALYLMDRGRKKLGVVAYGAAMLTHFQALVSPVAQLANTMIGRRYWLAIVLIIVSQLAVVFQLVPASSIMRLLMDEDSRRLTQNLYIDNSMFGIKGTNALIILLLAMTIFPLKRMIVQYKLLGYCFSSVVIGYMFYWLFAGIPVLPDRVLQFFWVPLVILVSLGRHHKPTYLATIMVGAMFFMLTAFIAPILVS